jgi:hypothetical protein
VAFDDPLWPVHGATPGRHRQAHLPGARLRLTTQKTGKTLTILMAEPLERHVESLPVSDDQRAPLHPRAYGALEAVGKTGGLSNQFADLLAQAGLRARR